MALTSPLFLAFLLAVILLFHGSASVAWRRTVLTVANAVFLASFVDHPGQLLPLAGFLALGYLGLLVSGTRARCAWALAVIVFVFAYLKRYAFLGPLPSLPFSYLSVGLSYILFRMLQLVIDRGAGEVQSAPSPRAFFDYTCNFLTFVSGPIERAEDFSADQARVTRPINGDLAYRAFARLVIGYFKVAAVSACANYVFAHVSEPLLADGPGPGLIRASADFAVACASYTAYLYYNFAGYMDIVIGAGWLLGMDLPENFNHPFQARNLFEFWARWHMTLSEWFKIYLFNPLLSALAARITSPAAMPYIGVFAFFVSFFVMGVWHGSTLVFVIYGLVMGGGVIINKLWQMGMTARLGKKRYRTLGERTSYALTARAITTSFFAIAVTALWVDLKDLRVLAEHVGALGTVATFVGLALAAAVYLPLSDAIGARATAWREAALAAPFAPVTRQAALGATVLLVLAVASFFHKAPEFVYKAF